MIFRRHQSGLRFAIGLLVLVSVGYLTMIFVHRNIPSLPRVDPNEGFVKPSASTAWAHERQKEAADNKRGVAVIRKALAAAGLDGTSLHTFTNGQPYDLYALSRLLRRVEATRNPSRHSNGLNPAEVLADADRFSAGAGQKLHEFWMAFFGDGRNLERHGNVPPEWVASSHKTSSREELSLRDANRQHLARLAHLLLDQGGEEALCSAPFPPRQPPSSGPLRWLHVPKSGTSFANTLLPWGCGDAWPAGLHLGSSLSTLPLAVRAKFKKATAGTRELAAVAHYVGCSNTSHNLGTDGSSSSSSSSSSSENPYMDGNGDIEIAFSGWSEHASVRDPSGKVAIFRAPSQRLLSAFYFDCHIALQEMHHPDGFAHADYTNWLFRTNNCSSVKKQTPSQSARAAQQFARTPGIGGCLARMLNGCSCTARPLVHHSSTNNPRAAHRFPRSSERPELEVVCGWDNAVMNEAYAQQAAAKVAGMAFVGLQEFYNASVCLFHRTFGGPPSPTETAFFNVGPQRRHSKNAYSKYAPLEGQLKRPESVHRSDTSRHEKRARKTARELEHYFPMRYDETVLDDYVDSLDEVVFEAILQRFESDVQKALLLLK